MPPAIPFRTGIGYDVHPLRAGLPLMVGGILIPHDKGAAGHSDADTLIHAICDALLGAAALGDIGSHFPDTDSAWKDADSAAMLTAVVREVKAAGWTVGNIDATVICERPKLRPYVDSIRARIAELLECQADAVSVKGKTNEGMDATGQCLGVAVHCVALLSGGEA